MRRARLATAATAVVLTTALTAGHSAPGRAAGTCRGMAVTLLGTEGDDTIRGTSGPDVIDGLGGDDVIEGLGGDDTLCGDSGDDRLRGGAGDDACDGGPGRDESTSCESTVSIP